MQNVQHSTTAVMAAAPIPMPGRLPDDWYTTAARAEHNLHCANCREQAAASDAAVAANGASMARRDRRQLGLNLARTTAVTR